MSGYKLSEILKQSIIVLKGIQRGAKLYPVRGVPIPQEQASLPKNIVLEKYFSPFYLTLERDPTFPNLFQYTLDELSVATSQWYRQLGVAHVSGKDQISINETDGMIGQLVSVGTENLILYRSRTGETPTVMHAEHIEISSVKYRDREIYKKH